MRTEEKIKGNTKTRRKFSNENDFIKKSNKCFKYSDYFNHFAL